MRDFGMRGLQWCVFPFRMVFRTPHSREHFLSGRNSKHQVYGTTWCYHGKTMTMQLRAILIPTWVQVNIPQAMAFMKLYFKEEACRCFGNKIIALENEGGGR
jgi:hypothetical protein